MKLTIDKLSKQYNSKTAVDNFSVTLEEGVYGLLGPNGAGKSTLMRMMVDILKPTEGKITLDGEDIHALGESYRDKLGYLPQNFGVYKEFTAQRFLRYLAALKGLDPRKTDEKIDRLLKFVNLEDQKKKKIKTFSGGMKQRLGIAQALLNDPHILILDEPTAGLDPNERIRFRNLISEISNDRIVLLSTHIVSDIEFIAKSVIVMKNGKLLAKASPNALVATAKGKVWLVEINESQLESVESKYIVGNILRKEKGIEVKIISEEKPLPDAKEVPPELEDYYLLNFGEEARSDLETAV